MTKPICHHGGGPHDDSCEPGHTAALHTMQSGGRHVSLADIEQPDAPHTLIGKEIGQMLTEKQRAYGDSFSKAGGIVAILYPGGIYPEKLDDALTIIRVIDKLFRIATDRDALGESPWRDIAGYAILSVKRDADRKATLRAQLTK